MATDQAQVRFQLIVNGEVKCTAGIEEFGAFDVSVSWIKRDPAKDPHYDYEEGVDDPEFAPGEWSREQLDIRVGGIDSEHYLIWYENEADVGDEIIIKILGPGTIDSASKKEHREG